MFFENIQKLYKDTNYFGRNCIYVCMGGCVREREREREREKRERERETPCVRVRVNRIRH